MGTRFNNLHNTIKQECDLFIAEAGLDSTLRGQLSDSGANAIKAVGQKAISTFMVYKPGLDKFIRQVTSSVQNILMRSDAVAALPAWNTQPRADLQIQIDDLKVKIEKWVKWVNGSIQTKLAKQYKIKLNILLTDLNEAQRKAVYRTRTQTKTKS